MYVSVYSTYAVYFLSFITLSLHCGTGRRWVMGGRVFSVWQCGIVGARL